MAEEPPYIYPVTSPWDAKEVTEPEFRPDLFNQNDLYVNFDEVRGERYLSEMLFDLNINPTDFSLIAKTKNYLQILFSGHRGCGKSAELMRIHKQLNKPTSYVSIFINLEDDADFARFESEDFYLLLLLKLMEVMGSDLINKHESPLNDLAEKLKFSTEIKREINESFKSEATAEIGTGLDLLGFLKVKSNFKNVFAGENKSSKTIREEIRRNINEWITDFNRLLDLVRKDFQQQNKGEDILFIIDGSEKLKEEIYRELFVTNGFLIKILSVNMIIAVPINSYYNIIDSPRNFHSRYVIPMIPIEKPGATEKLKELVTKRIDRETFLEDEAFDLLVQNSGGCIRQLFILVNRAIVIGTGSKIDLTNAQLAVKDYGNRLYEVLRTEHIEAIKKDKKNTGNQLIRELLYGLILLKYNGPESIKLNPVLEGKI